MSETRTDESAAEAESETDQPGLDDLRAAVASAADNLPSGGTLRNDGLAGLNSAVANVPDGLASGVLAGVNPVYGLYAGLFGPIVGGLFSGSQLMIITTTSASALAAGQALAGLPADGRDGALFTLVVLVGIIQLAAGLLGLGRLTRFVSYSVMTGFLTGIAVLTILSQLPTVTGYPAEGSNNVAKALDLLANLGQVHVPSIALGILTIALALILPRTPLGNAGNLVAIAVPSVLVLLLGLSAVEVVQDVGEVPTGLPTPVLPSLSAISVDVVTGALAIAVIVLVQGAGVSQSVPNPDGTRASTSRDFIGQGAANVASGLFRGLPVGGSLGSTSLNVISGARSRWAAVFAGLWVAVIVLVFPGVIARVAMPALGALLMVASASAVKPEDLRAVWAVGAPSRIALVTTFVGTLLLPIQVAVGIGVTFSAVLQLYRAGQDVSVVERVEREDGRIEEREPPDRLPSNRVTVLDVYGHLFYAGARTLARRLPNPEEAERPVVVLRLRGRVGPGATLFEELSNYADRLAEAGGRLYLSGIHERAYDEYKRSDKLRQGDDLDKVRLYMATPIVGESTRQAIADARAWLAESDEAEGGEEQPGQAEPEDEAGEG